MSFVCESEMSEMKVRMYRCTMWKAQQGLFNGTAELLCARKKGINVPVSVHCMGALKNILIFGDDWTSEVQRVTCDVKMKGERHDRSAH